MMGKRIYYLDTLRAGAVFCAIICAAAADFAVYHPLRAYVPAESGSCWFGFDILCAAGFAAAAPVIFFLSAYFGASSLRMHLINTYIKTKWQRLGWPWLFGTIILAPELLYLAACSKDSNTPFGYAYGQSAFCFLGFLLLCHLVLCAVKAWNRSLFQRKAAAPPSFLPLLAVYIIQISAAAFLLTGGTAAWYVFYCAVTCAVYFGLGFYAFRHRWFTEGAYVPSLRWLFPCAAALLLTHIGGNVFLPANQSPYGIIFLFSFVSLPALFSLLALFSRYGNASGKKATYAVSLAYPLYFLSDTLIQNTLYMLRPLQAGTSLKLFLALILSAIYGYMLCKYILFHIPCFKPKS